MYKWVICALLLVQSGFALPKGYIYDEKEVPKYELPALQKSLNGKEVQSVEQWEKQRRSEVLELFEKHVYGEIPLLPYDMEFELRESGPALEGLAVRKQIRIHFKRESKQEKLDLLLYLPSKRSGPSPLVMTVNFKGNHTLSFDPKVFLCDSWVKNHQKLGITNNRANEASRGIIASRWPLKMILEKGVGIGSYYYGEMDPDVHDEFKNGIHAFFDQPRDEHAWGAISAWSWGLSRCMDYFESSSDIDAKKITVMGHSRLGKTALWTGARDTRFAMVISNNSGCGGAALSRREFGEIVDRITTSFPHWFNAKYRGYAKSIGSSPLDQHMLLALVAPRTLYVASAAEDLWADPRGEFLSTKWAGEVYQLYGKTSLLHDSMPALDSPLKKDVRYHCRSGKHDVLDYD